MRFVGESQPDRVRTGFHGQTCERFDRGTANVGTRIFHERGDEIRIFATSDAAQHSRQPQSRSFVRLVEAIRELAEAPALRAAIGAAARERLIADYSFEAGRRVLLEFLRTVSA